MPCVNYETNNMQLHELKRKTPKQRTKRVGRGGKRGTTSGGGTKGQKSRSGAGVKPGFRGGDNRLWQLFPKQRGASKKPGNSSPHRKHRFYRLQHDKMVVLNLSDLNAFSNGDTVTPALLLEKGLVQTLKTGVKILGNGELKKKLTFEGEIMFSKSAKEKLGIKTDAQ
jgi:large subunit ribosomal protein L15